MFKLIANAKQRSGYIFDYAVMNLVTNTCYGFKAHDAFERAITHSIDAVSRGTYWVPTGYTEISSEFSTLSDLKQTNPELFI